MADPEVSALRLDNEKGSIVEEGSVLDRSGGEWSGGKNSFLSYRGGLTTDDDESDDDDVRPIELKNTEDIRRQLAAGAADSSSSSLGPIQDNSLLLCFRATPESGAYPTEKTSSQTTRGVGSVLGGANISNKSQHVIIPISSVEVGEDTFISETSIVQENPLFRSVLLEDQEDEDECQNTLTEKGGRTEGRAPEVQQHPSSRELQLQNNVAFFEQLASIQTKARRELRQAQTSASRAVEADRRSRDLKKQIVEVLSCSSKSGSESIVGVGKHSSSRKLNRRVLTRLNVGQLQVVLNFFLSKIETLNDNLVEYLLTRDELAIEQDSLLTDIEDITKCISSANS